MSELGKCPTCGGKIATVSKVCLHCGERDFIETKREGSRKVVCYDCRGSGSCIVGLEWMLGITGRGSSGDMPCMRRYRRSNTKCELRHKNRQSSFTLLGRAVPI